MAEKACHGFASTTPVGLTQALAVMPTFLATLLFAVLAIPPAVGNTVAPGVYGVVSGGYWAAQERAGHYRVVVVNSGFEHVTSRVFVQWVAGPLSASEAPTVIASVEPALPFGQGIASLEATLQPLGTNRVKVLLTGVVATQPQQQVNAVITATVPGQAAVNDG